MKIRKNVIPIDPYPELPSILKQFSTEIQNLFSEDLVGIDIVGSIALGDFDLDSDVDFLVITNYELDKTHTTKIERIHCSIFNMDYYPAKHLEGSYISKEALIDFRTIGKKTLLYLDNGSTKLKQSTHDNKWHIRWILRELGIALVGPPAKAILPKIPISMVHNELIETAREIEALFEAEIDKSIDYYNTRFGQSFVVLTICRMLHTIFTGRIYSKKAGVEWALKNIDQNWHKLINFSWEERKGVRFCSKIQEEAKVPVLNETLEFIRHGIELMEKQVTHH